MFATSFRLLYLILQGSTVSLSRALNELEGSNSKLVGPSDCQDGDDGVELELRSDPAYCKYTDYESYTELLGNALKLNYFNY